MKSIEVSLPHKLADVIEANYPGARLELRAVRKGEIYYNPRAKFVTERLEDSDPDELFLVIVPPEPKTITRWANVTPEGRTWTYSSKEVADQNGECDNRVACVKITGAYVPGDGLS